MNMSRNRIASGSLGVDYRRIMQGSFMDSRQAVKQSIDLIESCVGGDRIRLAARRPFGPWPDDDVATVREEIARLEFSTQAAALMAQARTVWEMAVYRKQSTIWFLRNYRPVTMLIFQICEVAAIPCARLLAGRFAVRDFPVLVSHAGKLAAAPLKLCDARPPSAFLDSLAGLVETGAQCAVVCDWVLEGKELEAARYASREGQISFRACDRPAGTFSV